MLYTGCSVTGDTTGTRVILRAQICPKFKIKLFQLFSRKQRKSEEFPGTILVPNCFKLFQVISNCSKLFQRGFSCFRIRYCCFLESSAMIVVSCRIALFPAVPPITGHPVRIFSFSPPASLIVKSTKAVSFLQSHSDEKCGPEFQRGHTFTITPDEDSRQRLDILMRITVPSFCVFVPVSLF